MLIAQLALNALALGSAYALVAIGFVLVLNATTAVNFAHGESVVAGGFAAVALAMFLPPDLGIPGLILLPGVLVVTAVLGLTICALAYLPIRNRPPVSVLSPPSRSALSSPIASMPASGRHRRPHRR